MNFTFFKLAIFVLLAASVQCIDVQDAWPFDPTAAALAKARSIHWWTIRLPKDLQPKDRVGVEVFAPDGKRLAGGGGFSAWPGEKTLGDSIKVFCWEDEARHEAKVGIQTLDGSFGVFPLKDYFANSVSVAASDGMALQTGDILLKFDSSKNPPLKTEKTLRRGQVGLRVVIARRP